MARLRVTDHEKRVTTVDLEPGCRVRIGRGRGNEIVLDDPSLSREHAEIYEQAGSFMLKDCNSKNGVFVGGRQIDAPVLLESGLTASLGNCRIGLESSPDSAVALKSVTFDDGPLMASGTVVMRVADAMSAESSEASDAASFRAELEKIRKRFQIVEKSNLELLAHESTEVLLPKVLDLVFEAVRPERAALLRRQPDGELVCRAYRGDDQREMSISRTIANTVIDQQVSVLTADAQADERFAAGVSIMSQGIRAVMAVPLWNKKEVIGLIYADSRLRSELFDQEDLRVLTMLANVAAIQIENASLFAAQVEKRRFETEAKAAAAVQQRLLPRSRPEIPGYALEWRNTPCYECGGDYYDCLDLGDGRTGVILADVAGKGMGAAMLMAVIQATLRSRADAGPAPAELVDHLGEAISRSAPSNRYATLFLADLDRKKHRVSYVNAGHAPLPLVVRPGGEVVELPSGGTPLGLFPGTIYPVTALDLSAGDFIFACSDGVTDIENPDGDMFGEDRLRELLASLAGRSCGEIRTELDRQIEGFAGDTRQPDDLTYLILQRTS